MRVVSRSFRARNLRRASNVRVRPRAEQRSRERASCSGAATPRSRIVPATQAARFAVVVLRPPSLPLFKINYQQPVLEFMIDRRSIDRSGEAKGLFEIAVRDLHLLI